MAHHVRAHATDSNKTNIHSRLPLQVLYLVLRQTPRESVRGTQRDNLHPLKSRYAPVDSKLRVRLLCSEAHPRVLIHEAQIVWCGPEARAYPRHETTSSILIGHLTLELARKKGVVPLLFADCGHRAVTRANDRLVRQCQDFLEIIL